MHKLIFCTTLLLCCLSCGKKSDPAAASAAATTSSTPAAAVDPITTTANLRFYYRSDDITSSGWSDYSGHITGTGTPVGALNVITTDGFRALHFDGTVSAGECKALEIADNFSNLVGGNVSFTFFGVIRPAVFNYTQTEFLGVSSLALGFSFANVGANAGPALIFGDFTNPDVGYTSSRTAVGSTYRIVTMTVSANTLTLIHQNRANGTLAGVLNEATIADSTLNARIGNSNSGHSDCFQGDIAELAFFNRALSAAEISAIECKLSSRFGLGAAGC